jgi:hypothetical protein
MLRRANPSECMLGVDFVRKSQKYFKHNNTEYHITRYRVGEDVTSTFPALFSGANTVMFEKVSCY